jgi:hypothetical protein
MPDQTITNDALGPTVVPVSDAPAFDPVGRARELAILDALRSVVDPEIGMNVVELALIRQVLLGDELTEIKMMYRRSAPTRALNRRSRRRPRARGS